VACEDMTPLLHASLDDELDAEHATRVERHLADRPSRHHLSLLAMDLAPTEPGPGLPDIGERRLRMIDSDKC